MNNGKIFAKTECELFACEIFGKEMKKRIGITFEITHDIAECDFAFVTDSILMKDCYKIIGRGDSVIFSASGIRGFIYAMGMFLRKGEICENKFLLTENIFGYYKPDKSIRGHQLGYRTTPNTYDAWDIDDYERYYLDMMFFGSNTVEHIPYERGVSNRNKLMKYDEEELLIKASELADKYDLDVSIWHPNNDGETTEEAVARRKKLYERVPRIDVIFPPGGDPGEFPADEFVERCIEISKALKESHPNAQMWPSAQAPHSIPNWGDGFVSEMEKLPDEINGVIIGPNRAFDIDVLRRKLPNKYPLRLYPDITHNVRCEYPVHYGRDDWHFALTTGLSRECTNPRPREYRYIHRLTRPYVIGSVSYSEGVTDDVNKMVWADMDFFPNCELRTSLLDYCRLFFYGADPYALADAILMLEINWECDPAENPAIDSTLALFVSLSEKYIFLNENWRFLQLLFRAKCDYILRHRRIFELDLIKKAKTQLLKGDFCGSRKILETDFDDDYKKQRADINKIAEKLFALIGLQLDVENYCANSWERGAVLETIDLPNTDRSWLLNRFEYSETTNDPAEFMLRCFDRNVVESDEYYFSVALHGIKESGFVQDGEIYMNFRGDRPELNNGSLPTGLFNVYDNLTYRHKIGGLVGNCDYKLIVSFFSKKINTQEHKVTVNGKTIYEGTQFGKKDDRFDSEMLAPGFESATYFIPGELIENGCIDLVMSEPDMGIMFAEFRVIKSDMNMQ